MNHMGRWKISEKLEGCPRALEAPGPQGPPAARATGMQGLGAQGPGLQGPRAQGLGAQGPGAQGQGRAGQDWLAPRSTASLGFQHFSYLLSLSTPDRSVLSAQAFEFGLSWKVYRLVLNKQLAPKR